MKSETFSSIYFPINSFPLRVDEKGNLVPLFEMSIIGNTKDLEPEIVQTVNENFWKLFD